ncbi:MAG: DUF2202 domain-containing protein [Saprospiraceae bacterium]|nr:DUF2202 domain-containing protein [Saprospiraceae bacterium]
MKTLIKNYVVLLVLALGTTTLLLGCEKESETEPNSVMYVDLNGYSRFNHQALVDTLDRFPKGDLSDEEMAGLLFIHEEEKLAHDVYTVLYQRWDNQVFYNIARSEQTHTNAVRVLIERYDLIDPANPDNPGVFRDTSLQRLYDMLVVSGFESEIEALQVGAAIEEIDILDLEWQLENVADNPDIVLVYQNLQRGSRNHLRAFVRNLTRRGIDYEPRYMTRILYDQTVGDQMERGR